MAQPQCLIHRVCVFISHIEPSQTYTEGRSVALGSIRSAKEEISRLVVRADRNHIPAIVQTEWLFQRFNGGFQPSLDLCAVLPRDRELIAHVLAVKVTRRIREIIN